MEEKYSIVEYTDIHFMYGKANGNALDAARLYAEAFPNRRHPDSRTFTRIHQSLRLGADQSSKAAFGKSAFAKTCFLLLKIRHGAHQSRKKKKCFRARFGTF